MLTMNELSLVFAHLQRALGVEVECLGPLAGGRSGAALYSALAEESETLVVRVTSKERAGREVHALRRMPSASSLWPAMGLRIIYPLPVVRGFPVAATVTRYLLGHRPLYSPDLCTSFQELFEAAQWRQSSSYPTAVVNLHMWLHDALPEYATAIRHSLALGLRQEWSTAFGHGDPSLSNLIATRAGDVLPIDFASGGIVIRRLHRARWFHAVHGSAGGEGTDCGICPTSDPVALITDAARRLRSDGADPVRSARWKTRILQLLETVG